MAKGAAGTNLLGFMVGNDPQSRASHYREEAEKFRSLAATETAVPLRNSLLYLARQYEQLAVKVLNRFTCGGMTHPDNLC